MEEAKRVETPSAAASLPESIVCLHTLKMHTLKNSQTAQPAAQVFSRTL